jgi:hypothetical protein
MPRGALLTGGVKPSRREVCNFFHIDRPGWRSLSPETRRARVNKAPLAVKMNQTPYWRLGYNRQELAAFLFRKGRHQVGIMVRWVAFDDDTAEAVVSKFRRGAAEIREGDTPLDAALGMDRPSVMILPSSTPGKVLLASVEPKTAAARAVIQRPSISNTSPVLAFGKPRGRALARPESSPKNRPSKKWWHRRSA